MRRENTDKIEQATDLRVVADKAINIAIQQAGSDPFHSLQEGESRLAYSLRSASDLINGGHMDTAKLRRIKAHMSDISAYSLRLAAMIDNDLDRLN